MNTIPETGSEKHVITVLLVDDQPMIGEAVRRMLASETDIEFHYCQKSAEAIPTAVDIAPTIILQDLFMPEVDGLTMVKYFRRDPATIDVPLIVLSSEENAKVKADAFALGANDYLIKLPDKIELIARIRYHSKAYINLMERNEAMETIIRKQAELLEAHHTLDTILSRVPIGIVILDFTGKVQWVNRPALNMIRQPNPEALIGREFREYIVDPQDLNDIHDCEFFNAERTLIAADRQAVPVMESVLKTSMNGNPVLICSFLDVSEQKRAQQEKQMIQVKLQQAQKLESVGKLAAGLAHEINTPLQFIRDNLKFIQQAMSDIADILAAVTELTMIPAVDTPDILTRLAGLKKQLEDADSEFIQKETAAAIDQSIDGLNRIAEIVLAMKEFANSSGGKIAHHDLNKMIENAITVSANAWRAVATLDTTLEPGGLDVMCCSEEINQVLLNLIINAVQAIADVHAGQTSPPPGTIHITSSRRQGLAVVDIRDSGIGIPDEIKNRIYEPFFTTREVGRGAGQGLTIAYDLIVNKHHGELSFISTPGQGTTFTIKLPIQPSAAATADREKP